MALTFLQATPITSDHTVYTFSEQNLGAEAADRHIIVVVAARGGANGTVASIAVGGVTATIVSNPSVTLLSAINLVAVAIAAVPTGATGDVVVTHQSGRARCEIGLYRATGLVSATPSDTGTDSDTGADPSTTIDVPAGGFAIGGFCSVRTPSIGTTSWTGLTADYDDALETVSRASGSSDTFESAQTGMTVTADGDANSGALAVVSWDSTETGGGGFQPWYKRRRVA